MINQKKIGLALSGGGVRAIAFHLGVLKRLAEENLLENVTEISSVSGGSLLIGLIYSMNKNKWPTSTFFLQKIIPKIHSILTTTNIEIHLFLRSILFSIFTFQFWKIFWGKANILSRVFRNTWKIKGKFDSIPENPCWHINATCYESGKRWRFKSNSEFKMGDYKFGYTKKSKLYLSDVIACSAAFPILIGTFVINPKKYKWCRYSDYEKKQLTQIVPEFNKLHLWDGGVYDNNGIEALFKGNKLKGDLNYLIICEASPKIKEKKKNFFPKDLRLIDILMDQVRSIKTRQLMSHFLTNNNCGLYFQIGNTVNYIQKSAKEIGKEISIENPILSEKEVDKVSDYPTRLFRMKENDFILIMKHGWEVAHYTMKAYM